MCPWYLARVLRVLNTINCLLTLHLHWITGGGVEGNPLMAALLEVHPAVFVMTKLGVIVLSSVVLAALRQRWVLVGACMAYVCACAMNAGLISRWH